MKLVCLGVWGCFGDWLLWLYGLYRPDESRPDYDQYYTLFGVLREDPFQRARGHSLPQKHDAWWRLVTSDQVQPLSRTSTQRGAADSYVFLLEQPASQTQPLHGTIWAWHRHESLWHAKRYASCLHMVEADLPRWYLLENNPALARELMDFFEEKRNWVDWYWTQADRWRLGYLLSRLMVMFWLTIVLTPFTPQMSPMKRH